MSEMSERREFVNPKACRQCRSCKFWEFVEEKAKDSAGECRRRAPAPLAERDVPQVRPDLEGRWPIVGACDWCGEWEHDGGMYIDKATGKAEWIEPGGVAPTWENSEAGWRLVETKI